MILNKLADLANGLPIILMGDFNTRPESDVIHQIIDTCNNDHLIDARSISPIVYGPSWTFHNFGKIPYEKRPLIEYVFINKNIEVLKHGIWAENKKFLSDHTTILVSVEIKGK